MSNRLENRYETDKYKGREHLKRQVAEQRKIRQRRSRTETLGETGTMQNRLQRFGQFLRK